MPPMPTPLLVTPQTKVLALIEAYPHLEEVLINYVPAFRKLRNPVLRRTVARVATLQQAAAVGGVPVEELVNRMRRELGQDHLAVGPDKGYATDLPDWFDPARLAPPVDVAAILAAGEQPVHRVLAELRELPGGQIYTLLAPFLPAPLIDKATSLGLRHYVVKEADERFSVYFCREAAGD